VTNLTPELERTLRDLARDWPALEVLVVFGSGGRKQLRPDSDLDLYVRLERGAERETAAEHLFLEGAERAAQREVDLIVERPETSVLLRREVAAKGRVLFERRPGSARQLVVDAIRDYVDLEPYLSRIGAAIRARAIAEGEAARARLAERLFDGG
jgi:predicted nucleotidyltransferase